MTASEIILDTKFAGYGSITSKVSSSELILTGICLLILLLLQDEGYRYYFGTVQLEKFSPTIQVVAENSCVMILLLLQDEGYHYYFGTVQLEKFSPTILVVAENSCMMILLLLQDEGIH